MHEHRPAPHRRAAPASPGRPRDRRRWRRGRPGAGPARSPAAAPATATAGRRACRWRRRGSRRRPPSTGSSNRVKLSSWLSSRLSDSGVVSRICGGRTRWRALRSAGVSPVRVSTRIGSAHLGDRGQQIALHVDRQRLERRDVERVQPVGRRLDQLGERRQEAGQRLAGAGRRDQQGAPPGPRRGQHFELVPAHRPALAGEPVGEDGGKRLGSRGHPSHIAPMARLGSWVKPFPEGIYVAPADAWIDPSRPKAQGAGHPRPWRPCPRRP